MAICDLSVNLLPAIVSAATFKCRRCLQIIQDTVKPSGNQTYCLCTNNVTSANFTVTVTVLYLNSGLPASWTTDPTS